MKKINGEHAAFIAAQEAETLKAVAGMALPAHMLGGNVPMTATEGELRMREVAEQMRRRRVLALIESVVTTSVAERMARTMNRLGIKPMEYRKRQFLASAAAIWPYPRKVNFL